MKLKVKMVQGTNPRPTDCYIPIILSDSATRKAIKFGTGKNHENGSVPFLLNAFAYGTKRDS